jgi:Alpha/beta hydrolase domain containing 18
MSKHLRRFMRLASATLDQLYATTVHSGAQSKFFAQGWGDLSSLNRDQFVHLVHDVQTSPSTEISWKRLQSGNALQRKQFEYFEGDFMSPCANGRLPGLPESCHSGKVWLIRPKPSAELPTGMKACVIQLAATGEHSAR